MTNEKRLNQIIKCLKHCANDEDCETCLRWEQYVENRYCVDDLMILAAEELEKLVDAVEAVHGHWEFEDDTKMIWTTKAICSACKCVVAHNVDLSMEYGRKNHVEQNKYCPNCGADMRGKEDA